MDAVTLPFVYAGLFFIGVLAGYALRGRINREPAEGKLSLQAWTRVQQSDPQLEAAAALGAARAARATALPHLGLMDHDRLAQIARLVASIVKLWRRNQGRPRIVLWVDDSPAANALETLSLEALGITTVTALSTEEALAAAQGQRFSAIVSDMTRDGDPQAGFKLLEALRQRGVATPFVIYSNDATPTQRLDIRRRGALDCTDDPQELVRLVNQGVLISLSRDPT